MSCKNHKVYNAKNVDWIQFSATGIRCYACWLAVTLPWLSQGMLRTARPEAVEELLEKCDSVIRAESSCPLLLENHVCERDCVKMLVLERTQNSELKHAA